MRIESHRIVVHLQLAVITGGPIFIRLFSEALEVLKDAARFGQGRMKAFFPAMC